VNIWELARLAKLAKRAELTRAKEGKGKGMRCGLRVYVNAEHDAERLENWCGVKWVCDECRVWIVACYRGQSGRKDREGGSLVTPTQSSGANLPPRPPTDALAGKENSPLSISSIA